MNLGYFEELEKEIRDIKRENKIKISLIENKSLDEDLDVLLSNSEELKKCIFDSEKNIKLVEEKIEKLDEKIANFGVRRRVKKLLVKGAFLKKNLSEFETEKSFAKYF